MEGISSYIGLVVAPALALGLFGLGKYFWNQVIKRIESLEAKHYGTKHEVETKMLAIENRITLVLKSDTLLVEKAENLKTNVGNLIETTEKEINEIKEIQHQLVLHSTAFRHIEKILADRTMRIKAHHDRIQDIYKILEGIKRYSK